MIRIDVRRAARVEEWITHSIQNVKDQQQGDRFTFADVKNLPGFKLFGCKHKSRRNRHFGSSIGVRRKNPEFLVAKHNKNCNTLKTLSRVSNITFTPDWDPDHEYYFDHVNAGAGRSYYIRW